MADEDTPWWTLNGFWLPTEERYTSHQQALSWLVAQDLANMEVQEIWEMNSQTGPAQFRWTGIFPGKHHRVDPYRFLDPDQME